MEEKQILVKDIQTNYKIIGQGRPMLVLHGWGSSSEKWVATAQILAQKGIQMIIPDLPGFGASAEPKTAWNLDNYTDWAREFSQNVPELSKNFYLLGHSFGGAIAVKFTIKYNQGIEKLFLVAAACVREKTFIKKWLYRFSKIVKIFSFLPYYTQFRKAFYKFIIKRSDYPYFSGIMKETYLKVVLEDLSWRLPFVKVPTTLIWGDKDDLTPMRQAHIINQRISHSNLVVIPGVGHPIQIKMPEVLAEKILENLPIVPYGEQLLSLKNII